MMENNLKPIVSIICPTYNQEKFIASALDGFLMQKTTFPFEIIVHDDASTDGTPAIVKGYESKYPETFRNIYQTENQLSKANNNVIKITLAASRGKYIAFCEGDDYWNDPLKLQRQVDFLETNPDFSISCHRVFHLLPGMAPEIHQGSESEETYTIDDLAKGNFIATVSVVFKNGLLSDLPFWLKDAPLGDYVLHMFNARHGKIKYFPQPMAVYRHGSGVWSGQQKDVGYKKLVNVIDFLLLEFSDKKVRENLILQKLNYFMWIEDWSPDFNPSFSREEIIIFVDARRNEKEKMESILNNPAILASKVSLKTLVNSVFKKLRIKKTHKK